jgi:hypothetical protein
MPRRNQQIRRELMQARTNLAFACSDQTPDKQEQVRLRLKIHELEIELNKKENVDGV